MCHMTFWLELEQSNNQLTVKLFYLVVVEEMAEQRLDSK